MKSLIAEEKERDIYKTTFRGKDYIWIGHTSRDQYSGAFFGLSVAYNLVDDPAVRAVVKDTVTTLLDNLLSHHWAVVMPNIKLPTNLFAGHWDQQAHFLALGNTVNPQRFGGHYRRSRRLYHRFVGLMSRLESHAPYTSYYKFNLDHINLFSLILNEKDGHYRASYRNAYRGLQKITAGHGNAFFNLMDNGALGNDPQRDAETVDLLERWLKRPRRDTSVDHTKSVKTCAMDSRGKGTSLRACEPIPVELRYPTDFVWQRSPFGLTGGHEGTIEPPGIDYVLPYWMARYYGLAVKN